jgi:hypothetical protein
MSLGLHGAVQLTFRSSDQGKIPEQSSKGFGMIEQEIWNLRYPEHHLKAGGGRVGVWGSGVYGQIWFLAFVSAHVGRDIARGRPQKGLSFQDLRTSLNPGRGCKKWRSLSQEPRRTR